MHETRTFTQAENIVIGLTYKFLLVLPRENTPILTWFLDLVIIVIWKEHDHRLDAGWEFLQPPEECPQALFGSQLASMVIEYLYNCFSTLPNKFQNAEEHFKGSEFCEHGHLLPFIFWELSSSTRSNWWWGIWYVGCQHDKTLSYLGMLVRELPSLG